MPSPPSSPPPSYMYYASSYGYGDELTGGESNTSGGSVGIIVGTSVGAIVICSLALVTVKVWKDARAKSSAKKPPTIHVISSSTVTADVELPGLASSPPVASEKI